MSVKRIFLGTKKDLSIGAICDVQSKSATAYKFNYTSEQTGLAGSREVALASVVNLMKDFETKELTAPVQFFVVSSLSDMITNQTYKYWILSGKKNDGTEVNAKELKLWKEFDKLMNKKGLYFIFKNLQDANFRGTPKFNQAEIAYNKFYYEWTWKQIHAIYPQGPAEPQMPETAGEHA